ncbi:MAG TPA: energy transducer TonB [Pyrinomonadaceae bacterium]|nr:energy transducer TonB [Pyrinomonadaceae bacterium]
MKKLALMVFAGLMLAGFAVGQDAVEWMRVESPSGDLSFAVPASGNIVFNDDEGYRIWHQEPGVWLSVMAWRNMDGKTMIKRQMSTKAGTDAKYFEVGDFIVRQYKAPDAVTKLDYQYLTLASSKGYYSISARVTKDTHQIYASFLNSIRLRDVPLFVGQPLPVESRTVRMNDLQTDDFVLQALKQPDPKDLELEPDPGMPATPAAPVKVEYSRDLIILRKPRTAYTPSARANRVSGNIALRVTFRADGQIGRVVLVKSLDKSLDREAFNAARRIKFLPAEVDGKPVEVDRVIEYGFSIY